MSAEDGSGYKFSKVQILKKKNMVTLFSKYFQGIDFWKIVPGWAPPSLPPLPAPSDGPIFVFRGLCNFTSVYVRVFRSGRVCRAVCVEFLRTCVLGLCALCVEFLRTCVLSFCALCVLSFCAILYKWIYVCLCFCVSVLLVFECVCVTCV